MVPISLAVEALARAGLLEASNELVFCETCFTIAPNQMHAGCHASSCIWMTMLSNACMTQGHAILVKARAGCADVV
jgi:hypothetical protein